MFIDSYFSAIFITVFKNSMTVIKKTKVGSFHCSLCLFCIYRPDWASAKTLLGDQNFLKRLVDFDKV